MSPLASGMVFASDETKSPRGGGRIARMLPSNSNVWVDHAFGVGPYPLGSTGGEKDATKTNKQKKLTPDPSDNK